MIYRRCQCGKHKSWESGMPPADCAGCADCGTALATGPGGHKPKIEHDWEPRFNEHTGAPDRRMCRRCYKIEKVAAE